VASASSPCFVTSFAVRVTDRAPPPTLRKQARLRMASPSTWACTLSCPVPSWSAFPLRFAPGCGRGFDSRRLHGPRKSRRWDGTLASFAPLLGFEAGLGGSAVPSLRVPGCGANVRVPEQKLRQAKVIVGASGLRRCGVAAAVHVHFRSSSPGRPVRHARGSVTTTDERASLSACDRGSRTHHSKRSRLRDLEVDLGTLVSSVTCEEVCS
jgi:hypothetical protein